MPALSLPDHWSSDATWLVQAADPRARMVRLVAMDAQAYRDASFLDDRLIQPDTVSHLASLDALVDQALQLSSLRGGWIFHIGHVGSTLISRLLGEISSVLPVREPRALRDLLYVEDGERPAVAGAIGRAMMRPLAGRTLPIVKATSFASEWAPLLAAGDEPCLFLTATPENYVASILAGPNSRLELNAMHDFRKARMGSRGLHFDDWPSTPAHSAAMAWACESTSLEAAAQALGDSVMFQDFDVALRDMGAGLKAIAAHFGIALTPEALSALVSSPLMKRYSKALEHDYSADLRRDLLAEARQDNLPEIKDAMARLDQAGARSELLGRALARSR